MTTLVAQPGPSPLHVDLKAFGDLDGKAFFELCQRNRHLRIERGAEGSITVMSPAGGRTSSRNANLVRQLDLWSEEDGRGVAFDSSGGFVLPNGAVRSPDAAWVERERLRDAAAGAEERFLPLCPTFAVELHSPSDELDALEKKMDEYLAQGASLGWLIDPRRERVHVYRPSGVEVLDRPSSLSGDPELPGFVLDLARVWDPGW